MNGLRRLTLIFIALVAVVATGYAAAGLEFAARLSGAQGVPAPGPGSITDSRVQIEFDDGFTEATAVLTVEGGDNVLAAHFHCARPGETGPVALGLFSPGPLLFDGEKASGTLTNDDFTGADCVGTIGRPVENLVSLALAMREGLIYMNVHTADNPPGEVRGQLLEDGDDDDDDDDDRHAMSLVGRVIDDEPLGIADVQDRD